MTDHEQSELTAKLANALVWKMEHLDPCGLDWETLSEREKEFYQLCIEYIFDQPETSQLLSLITPE